MVRTMGRIGWLAVVVLAVWVLGTGAAFAQEDEAAALRAAYAKGQEFEKEGKYKEAAASFETALELAPGVYGTDDISTGAILSSLAIEYARMGQYAKAEPLRLRSLQIREDKLGKDHPDVADSLNSLAALYEKMGQYAKAEPLYKRSLQIREDKLGKDHPLVAGILNNLVGRHARFPE